MVDGPELRTGAGEGAGEEEGEQPCTDAKKLEGGVSGRVADPDPDP